VLDNLRDKYSKEYDRVNPMDGVRVDLPEGWTLIRCSNTEPKIRMTVEGNDKETVEMLAERFGGDLEGEMCGWGTEHGVETPHLSH